MKNIINKLISKTKKAEQADFETIEINLDLPASERWNFAKKYQKEINDLVNCYWKEIEEYAVLMEDSMELYKTMYVPAAYQEEIKCLAKYCDFDENQLLLVNLYYDVIKFGFACTAFAFEENGSIWHARNLDWWTENKLLEKHTKVFDWKSNGKTVFKSVGWMGFIGVLSGMKPGQFSITLNAVLSEEEPNLAKPISLLLREILEEENTYNTAKEVLEKTPIVCDCLLLLSGTKSSEIAVIERTPRKSETRYAEPNYAIVTNDYKTEIVEAVESNNILVSTSCGRYDRTEALLLDKMPNDEEECFKILDDDKVKMQITVQQMVFNAKENNVFAKKP